MLLSADSSNLRPRAHSPRRHPPVKPTAVALVARKSHPTDLGPGSRPHTAAILTRRRVAIMGRKVTKSGEGNPGGPQPGDQDNYEFLEYEMPDLPPIDQIKDAISRNRVCRGMSYILPVDKSKNSIENVFKTDLRFMFRDPYRNELVKYNEGRIRASAKQHFVPNAPATRYVHDPDDYTKYVLNSDSEKIRKLYAQSAPPRGIVGKQTTCTSPELRTRSSLYLPIKTKLPPEAVRMKEEAHRILKSVQEKEGDDHEEAGALEQPPPPPPVTLKPVLHDPKNAHKNTLGPEGEQRKVSFALAGKKRPVRSGGCCPVVKKTDAFQSYEDLRDRKLPSKPPLPELFKSPFLSEQKNQDIWEWLTRDDVVTEFNHFLNVCS